MEIGINLSNAISDVAFCAMIAVIFIAYFYFRGKQTRRE